METIFADLLTRDEKTSRKMLQNKLYYLRLNRRNVNIIAGDILNIVNDYEKNICLIESLHLSDN
jgi:hypothetical protein